MESKITNKENKVNNEVDKTVGKVDSIKLKKQQVEVAKDITSGTANRHDLRIEISDLANLKISWFMPIKNSTILVFNKQGRIII